MYTIVFNGEFEARLGISSKIWSRFFYHIADCQICFVFSYSIIHTWLCISIFDFINCTLNENLICILI